MPLISNSLPRPFKRPGPLQERFLRLPFRSNLYELREERVISTLWGCFLRRICRNISLQSGPMSSYIDLDYNASRACGEDCSSQLLLTITTDAELARFSWRKAPSASSKYKYSYASADLYQSTLSGSKLSLLNFAIIPLEKPSSLGLENRSEETPLPFFHDSRLGSNFEFHRSSDPCLLYFLAWPIRVVNEASKEVAFGLDLTLYEGVRLAHLESTTAKTEIARPARAIKEVRNQGVKPFFAL